MLLINFQGPGDFIRPLFFIPVGGAAKGVVLLDGHIYGNTSCCWVKYGGFRFDVLVIFD